MKSQILHIPVLGYDVIFLVRLQGKFEIGHSWEWRVDWLQDDCLSVCNAQEALAEEARMKAKYENDTEIAKAKRDYELKKAAYDIEVFTKVGN